MLVKIVRKLLNKFFSKKKEEKPHNYSYEAPAIQKLTSELKDKLWEETNKYRNNWSEGTINELTFVKLCDSNIQWLELNKKHPSYIEHNNETYFLHGGWSQLFPMIGKTVQVTYLDN